MRAVAAVLLALVVAGCAQPPAPSPTPTPRPVPSLATLPSPRVPSPAAGPSAGTSLLDVLPAAVNGVATTKRTLNPANRLSPRVWLKVIARVGKDPTESGLAVASTDQATVYAIEVEGVAGREVMAAFIAERLGAAAASNLPTLDLGGKHVTRLSPAAPLFAYATGATFYYLDCRDDPTAIDVLGQLP